MIVQLTETWYAVWTIAASRGAWRTITPSLCSREGQYKHHIVY